MKEKSAVTRHNKLLRCCSETYFVRCFSAEVASKGILLLECIRRILIVAPCVSSSYLTFWLQNYFFLF